MQQELGRLLDEVALPHDAMDRSTTPIAHRHDGPVLGSRGMGDSEGVPHHDLGTDERPVGRRPRG